MRTIVFMTFKSQDTGQPLLQNAKIKPSLPDWIPGLTFKVNCHDDAIDLWKTKIARDHFNNQQPYFKIV